MGRRMMDVLNKLAPKEPTPGQILRAFRKREGLTLEDMWEITRVQVSNLSAIEHGKIAMTQHYAEIFAVALNVHPTVFLYPNGKFAKDRALLEVEARRVRVLKKHG